MSELSDKIRSEFKKSDDERDALMNTPEDVDRWDNIVYGHDDREMQKLDVYRPKQAQGEDLPVIISVHGGGWMYGDKERYQYYCMSLAQRGFAVSVQDASTLTQSVFLQWEIPLVPTFWAFTQVSAPTRHTLPNMISQCRKALPSQPLP